MDSDELKEFDNQEKDRILKIAKKHYKDDPLDINIFYEDLNLKKPYTSYNQISTVDLKPFQLRPFFKNIIIDIKRFNNETDFENHYGMSVNRLVELKDKGLFKFRLFDSYESYCDLEDDYLDIILYDKPPVAKHVNEVYGVIVNNNYGVHFKNFIDSINGSEYDFENPLRNSFEEFNPLFLSAKDIMCGYNGVSKNYPNWVYKTVINYNFRKLWACGHEEILEFFDKFLKNNPNRLDWIFIFSNVYSNFLSNPILDSLNGTHTVNSKLKYWARDLPMQDQINKYSHIRKINESLPDYLNNDFIGMMDESIKISTIIDHYDIDDYDFNGAIKALKSLEKTISTNDSERIIIKSNELKDELRIASEIAEEKQNHKEKISKIIKVFELGLTSIGAAGTLSGTTSYGLLLAAVSAADLALSYSDMLNITDRILDKFNKLHTDNHVCYIYDNIAKLNFHIPQRPQQLTLTPMKSEFKRELNKYHYFEYLYKNIPSIKVLIDTCVQKAREDNFRFDDFDFEVENELDYFENNIEFDFDLNTLLQNYFLYGKSYYIKEFYEHTDRIKSIEVVNPKHIQKITKNNEIYYRITQNENRTLHNKYISKLEDISMIEINMPMFDKYYGNISKIDGRPHFFHDGITNEK